MFPKPSILPKPSFVLFSFSVYFCQQRKASSLSLPQSQSSLVLKQTKLKARCKTNPLCLSPAHLSLSAVSHFFFTRSGGQWVNDYISSFFFFFFSADRQIWYAVWEILAWKTAKPVFSFQNRAVWPRFERFTEKMIFPVLLL